MARSIRLLIALTLLVALGVATISTTTAENRKVLTATMTGLATPGTIVAGVQGAGAAWVLAEGRATLTVSGRLHVEVEGLLLLNGTNPIDTGRALVSCNGVAAAMSDPVDFSDDGDAEVETTLTLPSPCLAPTVFFTNPAGTRWFAVSGF